MIENIEDLTFKQKEDFQKFVNIAYENKDLWWEKGDPVFLPLSDYLGEIELLNEILFNFPIVRREEDVNDNFIEKEIRKVLQLISDYEWMENHTTSSLHEVPLYCFRFKRHENIINNTIFNIENLYEIDTQQLLENLQDVLDILKTDKFDKEFWYKEK